MTTNDMCSDGNGTCMEEHEYRVVWTIDVSAASPEEAARVARQYQLDPASIANVFTVTCHGDMVFAPVNVDLDAIDHPEDDSFAAHAEGYY